eukprot:2493551-Rhodomonas_salina.1
MRSTGTSAAPSTACSSVLQYKNLTRQFPFIASPDRRSKTSLPSLIFRCQTCPRRPCIREKTAGGTRMPRHIGYTERAKPLSSSQASDLVIQLTPGDYVNYEKVLYKDEEKRKPQPVAAPVPPGREKGITASSTRNRDKLPPMAAELAGFHHESETANLKKHPGPYYAEVDRNGERTMATTKITPAGPQTNYVPICTVKKIDNDPLGLWSHTLHRDANSGAAAFVIIPKSVKIEKEDNVAEEQVEQEDHAAVPLWELIGLEDERWKRDDWTPWLDKEFEYLPFDETAEHPYLEAERQVMQSL